MRVFVFVVVVVVVFVTVRVFVVVFVVVVVMVVVAMFILVPLRHNPIQNIIHVLIRSERLVHRHPNFFKGRFTGRSQRAARR